MSLTKPFIPPFTMTEVLSITQQDSNSHFGAPLRRSSSQTSFLLQNATSYSRSSPNLRQRYAAVGYDTSKFPASLPSSAPSSPRLTAPEFSNQPSYTSTPSSSLSLDEQCQTEEEDVVFPSYEDSGYDTESKQLEPPTTPIVASPDAVTHSASDTCLSHLAFSNTLRPHPTAGDDTAIQSEPTRHVDYLSHNWKEEDIWASWRHIVAKRNVYSNSPRLENASWRTWTKSKYRLKTVSPETLNWYENEDSRRSYWKLIVHRMKDHDVTWLYGPLQTGNARPLRLDPAPPANQISRCDSFALKKPILKKRTLSEIMLQHSLSSSTLMKQATDALRAQQPGKVLRDRPALGDRTISDFGAPFTMSTTNPSTDPSTSTSGLQTPCTIRHIHFNNKVEQCIAIEKENNDQRHYFSATHHDDSSSEDDMLVMKPVKNATKAKISSSRSTPRSSFSSDSKTIAMLPSTTLNYRSDTPEPGEQQTKLKGTVWKGASMLSPSPSQQTLRPSSSTNNFLLDDEDEDADIDWQPSAAAGKRGSLYPRDGFQMNVDEDDDMEHSGMRRTPSGMFMPYEDEDDPANIGVFGRLVDTVNTAKDIAHVIWNVGWHR